MWLSVVCTLIKNDTCHHSAQSGVDWRGAAERVRNKFWPLWWRVSLSIRVHTTLNHIWFVFYHNKIVLHNANELLVCIRLSKTFANLLDMQKQYQNVRKKSNDAYLLSIRIQTTTNHILIQCFFCHNIRARAEQGIAWHIDVSSVVWTLIYHGKLANQIVRLAAIVVKNEFEPF